MTRRPNRPGGARSPWHGLTAAEVAERATAQHTAPTGCPHCPERDR